MPVVIAEKHVAKFNLTCQARHGLPVKLVNTRFSVNEGEDAFAGRQAKLELAPERGNTG